MFKYKVCEKNGESHQLVLSEFPYFGYEDYLKSENINVISTKDGKLVGSLIYKDKGLIDGVQHVHISYSVVNKLYRGNGINKGLYNFVVNSFNCPLKINLFINSKNLISKNFHEKMGFYQVPFDRELSYSDGGVALYYEFLLK